MGLLPPLDKRDLTGSLDNQPTIKVYHILGKKQGKSWMGEVEMGR